MRVVVDLDRCQDSGRCVEAAPEVFSLGPDGSLAVLDAAPADHLRRKVTRAARHCPTQAITVEP